MANQAWWIKANGRVDGPHTSRELKLLAKDGTVLADTLVSLDQKQWLPACKVKGLLPDASAASSSGDPKKDTASSRDTATYDAFLSYSTPDKPTADAICATLERNRIRCWIAPRDILPGKNYAEAIIDGINSCRLLVVVLSSASNGSPQVLREVERAVNRGIPIIPFRIEDVTPTKSMEYFLSAPHWLDALTPPMESHIGHLSTVVVAVLDPAQNAKRRTPPTAPGHPTTTVASPQPKQAVTRQLPLWNRQKLFLTGAFGGLAVLTTIAALLLSRPAPSNGTLPSTESPKLPGGKAELPPQEPAKHSPQAELLADEFDEYSKQVAAGRGSVVFLKHVAAGRYVSWRSEAEKGNAIAELFIARCYQEGLVVKQDYSAAIPWLERSAAKGNTFATHTLGLAYETGQGVNADPSTALQWYTRAAEAGNPISMRAVAGLHAGSTIGKPNHEAAMTWYHKAAERGDAVSMRLIGNRHLYGTGGIPVDAKEAERWYHKAAEAGDSYTIGWRFGDRLAPYFADYLKENATESEKAHALAALRDLRDECDLLTLPGFQALFDTSDLRGATTTLSALDASDPLQAFYDSIIQQYMSEYSNGSVSERTSGIYVFSQATEARVQRWWDNKLYDDIEAFYERSYDGVVFAELDPSLELNSLVRQLSWSAASLMRTGKRKEAAQLIDSAVGLCDRSLSERPWDWYTKDAYTGLCFTAAEAWIEVGEPELAQPLLRRGWTVSLRQFGRESLLEKYAELPQRGKVPSGATDDDRVFFEKFAPQKEKKGKSDSGIKRFTIPCDFSGKKYPFHVYVLTGPRGYAELQDQFRWLKEFRGGEVPADVRSSFQRLNAIASENKVDFMELCVYALGTAQTPEQKLADAEKNVAEWQAKYEKGQAPKDGQTLAEAYAAKAEALYEMRRYQDSMTEFRNGLAVCSKLAKSASHREWATQESERLDKRIVVAKLRNIASGEMATLLGNEAAVIPTLLQVRATEFFKDNDFEKVKDAADRLRQLLPKTKTTMYNAACAYSLCVSILEKQSSDGGPTATGTVGDCRRLAIQCMKDAIRLGYNDFEFIGKDSELDAIRDLDEFKALLPR